MACFHPLRAYRDCSAGHGKPQLSFAQPKGAFLEVSFPCGQCIGCRLEKSRQWAMRCMHEASLHDSNCFITLTYDDEHMPPGGSLDPRAFVLFLKRLRQHLVREAEALSLEMKRKVEPERFRYYHAAEYGDRTGRPHHHACLFGFDFRDKTPWTTRGGFPVWRSSLLESLWTEGLSEIGSVTFESAAYVARYILKKQNGRRYVQKAVGEAAGVAPQVVDRATGELRKFPEYATMSRRPAIGLEWWRKYRQEVMSSDSVVVRGREMKPPRYYDELFKQEDPEAFEDVARARRAKRRLADETPERLVVREVVAHAKQSLTERGLQ